MFITFYCLLISVLLCYLLSSDFSSFSRHAEAQRCAHTEQKGENIIGPLTGPSKYEIEIWDTLRLSFFLSCTSCLAVIMRCCQIFFLSSCNKREVQRVENSHRITLKLLLLFLMCINFSETLGGKLNCQ